MKTYNNEESFVNTFAKDAKSELKSGQNFEAVINGITVVVTGMDNNNSSKVTMYSGSVNGVEFTGSITALKKRLNVTFKKEYNRTAESSTKVIIKSDDELAQTAGTAVERIKSAVETINKYANRFCIPFETLVNDGFETTDDDGNKVEFTAYQLILEALKQQRDEEIERREKEAAKKAAETAKKIEAEKAKLEKQLAELQAKLAKMQ